MRSSFLPLVLVAIACTPAACRNNDANGGGAGAPTAPSKAGAPPASAPSIAASASAAADVPPADVRGLVNTLQAATHAPDAEERAEMLLQGCSEIPSCAGTCSKALSTAASGMSSGKEKDAALAACFPDFARDHEKKALSRQDWIERYMAAYADRALATLHGEDAKNLRELRAKLHATAP